MNSMRYFIGFIVTLGLIIILILLLFSGGGGDEPKKPKTPKSLGSYSNTDAVARLTINGPVNADQIHEIVQITVGRQNSSFEHIQGYEGKVMNSQIYESNENAYNNFLFALARAGFTKGNNSTLLANEKGYCSMGSRFVFELIENGRTIQRYWATNCSGVPKTYEGNLSQTIDLFQAQIPDYDQLTSKIQLN